ncbi:MAG: 3-demethylubiquinone-9 3-O-methyltransferase [Spirosoma sp.]|nr:3-demethylubiquinone-9 3-O-methyltransferase [Spirosoma sp.]
MLAQLTTNNTVYDADTDIWWNPDELFHMLKTCVNPARVGFFERILREQQCYVPNKTLLDVGCGGGILAEAFAGLGFSVTGIDPSAPSVATAQRHADSQGVDIRYHIGAGEQLPFADNSFDYVSCCDVLEHVQDVDAVLSEISRVLKPGGLFFYDTINRTWLSWLFLIKVAQDWPRWAFMQPNQHRYDRFITPAELIQKMAETGLANGQTRGMVGNYNILKTLYFLRQRTAGRWTYRHLGERMLMREGRDTNLCYMGWAGKDR